MSSSAQQDTLSSSNKSSSLESSGKSLSDSLSAWRHNKEDDNDNKNHDSSSIPQVSTFLDLYHSHALFIPSSSEIQTSHPSSSFSMQDEYNKNHPPIDSSSSSLSKSTMKKDMIQLYRDFITSYEDGLQQISIIQDFTTEGYTPDNIMNGNFTTYPYLESVKRNNNIPPPPPSSIN